MTIPSIVTQQESTTSSTSSVTSNQNEHNTNHNDIFETSEPQKSLSDNATIAALNHSILTSPPRYTPGYTMAISDNPVKKSQGIHVLSNGEYFVEVYPDDAKDKVLVAIVKALLKVGNRPMAPKEIANTILRFKLTPLGGATPYATVSSRISQHFKRAGEYKPNSRLPLLGRQSADEKQTRKLRYFLAQDGIPVGPPFSNEALESMDNDLDASIGNLPTVVDYRGALADQTKTKSQMRKSGETSDVEDFINNSLYRIKTSREALNDDLPTIIVNHKGVEIARSTYNGLHHTYNSNTESWHPICPNNHNSRNLGYSHFDSVNRPVQPFSRPYHSQASHKYLASTVRPPSDSTFPRGGGKSIFPLILAAEALLGDEINALDRKHKRLGRHSTLSSYAEDEDDDEYVGADATNASLYDELDSSIQTSSPNILNVKSFDLERSHRDAGRTRYNLSEIITGAPINQSPWPARNMSTYASPWRSVMHHNDDNGADDSLNQPIQYNAPLNMLSPAGWGEVRPPESITVNELDRLWGDKSVPRFRHRMNSTDCASPRRTPRIRSHSNTASAPTATPAIKRLQKTPHELFGTLEGENGKYSPRNAPENVGHIYINRNTGEEGRKRKKSVAFETPICGMPDVSTRSSSRQVGEEEAISSIDAKHSLLTGSKRSSASSMVSPKRPKLIEAPLLRTTNTVERSPRQETPRLLSNLTENSPLTPPIPSFFESSSCMELGYDPPVDMDPSHLELQLPQNRLPATSPPIYVTAIDGVGLYITWLKTYPHQQRGIPLMRRIDSDLVHGPTLLFAGGISTERERSIIFSFERGQVKVKIPGSPLSGTWISLFRARGLAGSCCLDAVLEQFLSDELSTYFDPAILSSIQPLPLPPSIPLITPYGSPSMLNGAYTPTLFTTTVPSVAATSNNVTPDMQKGMSPLSYFASTLAAMLAAQQAAQQKGLPIPELSYSLSKTFQDDHESEIHSSQQTALAAFIEAFKQAQARKAAGQSNSLLPNSRNSSMPSQRNDDITALNGTTTSLPPTDIASTQHQ